jgi:hypothetical protein
MLTLPDRAAASHTSAAAVFEVPVPAVSEVHVVVRRGWLESRIDGIRVHEARGPRDIVDHRGYKVTSPARTFVDLADLLTLVDLVVVGDAMVRSGLCTPEQLQEEARSARTRHVRLARRAASLVRARVDSPMETRLRLLLVLAGLPEPGTNLDVLDAGDRWVARPDLSYADVRIAIEYDGRHHAEDAGQWEHDIDRREAYDRNGWRVVVVTARQLLRRPASVLRRVAHALRERGRIVGSPSADWTLTSLAEAAVSHSHGGAVRRRGRRGGSALLYSRHGRRARARVAGAGTGGERGHRWRARARVAGAGTGGGGAVGLRGESRRGHSSIGG